MYNTTTGIPTTTNNFNYPSPNQNYNKKVVYLGYWLVDSQISQILTDLGDSGVSHALLTFINQSNDTAGSYIQGLQYPLGYKNTMIDSFTQLTSANQTALINSSFTIGFSIGGATTPYSDFQQTYNNPTSYYYYGNFSGNTVQEKIINSAKKYADDIVQIGVTVGLIKYFDLDIENIRTDFDNVALFIGEVCKQMRSKTSYQFIISHAPQTTYFSNSLYGKVYTTIYDNYKQYFHFFNIQFYNNGPSENYQQIFLQSSTSDAPGTSVKELMAGTQYWSTQMDPRYIVIGKCVDQNEVSYGGYVPLETMSSYVNQAKQSTDFMLLNWYNNGGEMIWYYCTQPGTSNTCTVANNSTMVTYFKTI
jgi:hypothetical protein